MDCSSKLTVLAVFTALCISLRMECIHCYPQKRATDHFLNTEDIAVLETRQLLGQIATYLKTLTKGLHLTAGDCGDVAAQGPYVSGIYTLTPWDDLGRQGAFRAYCDFETTGESWTVIQNRFNGSVDFYRDWEAYKNGFGDLQGEFWIGLDKINRLTKSGSSWKLRIELEDFDNNTAYAEYDDFAVGDESSSFQLAIGEYSGTAGDSLRIHADKPFSTKDVDNDLSGGSCAGAHKGAWWYNACHRSNLNAVYAGHPQLSTSVMTWYDFTRSHKALKKSTMKIRQIN